MKTPVSLVGLLAVTSTLLAEEIQYADDWCYPVTPFRLEKDGDDIHCPVRRESSPKYSVYYWSGIDEDGVRPRFGVDYFPNKWHLGYDFNGSSGGDSDKGDEVYAAADGYVVRKFTNPSDAPTWGTACVLKHHLPPNDPSGRSVVWTVYAHLQRADCPDPRGQDRFVPKGGLIGLIGDANGEQDYAHLHVELLVTEPAVVEGDQSKLHYLGRGYSFAVLDPNHPDRQPQGDFYPHSHYTDPVSFIGERLGGSAPAPCPDCQTQPGGFSFQTESPLQLLIDNTAALLLRWFPSLDAGFYRLNKIDAATNQPLAAAHLVSATEFIDTDVENGHAVRYEIEAINDAGVTVGDNTVTITPNVIQDPPRNFTLLSGASSCLNYQPAAFLWWTPSQGAHTYDVLRNGASIAVDIREREFSDFDIEEGVAYTYEVRAENPSGTRMADNTIAWTVPVGSCDAPAPPTAVTEAATVQNTFDVTFRGTFNARGAASVYWFEWGSQPTNYPHRTDPRSFGAGTADEVWTFTTFIGCEETVYYRSAAENSGGTAYGTEVSLTTPLCSVPAPGDLATTLNPDHTVSLFWTDNSINEAQFIISRTNADSSSSTLFSGENETALTDNLAAWPDGLYCYTVAGYSVDLGTGEPSNEACVTLPYQSGGGTGGGGGGEQTTYTFYPTVDGQVRSPSTPGSWDRQRNSAAGRDPLTDSSALKALVTVYNGSAGLISVVRTLLSFDTSDLPDSASVVSATLHVSVIESEDNFNDSYAWVSVFSADLADATSLSAGDFSACGETAGAEPVDVTDVSIGEQAFVLNPTGLSWINPSGFTTFCLREGHDADDIFISTNVGTWKGTGIALHAAESGATTTPYLEVVVE